jgi:alpha-glucoside transport system substrate-binding protein
MFQRSRAATTLINYLSSTPTQTEWVKEPGSYAFSASKAVKPSDYRTPVERDIAKLLQSGRTLCFSAADAMTPDLSAAFYQAVLDYVQKPDDLTTFLQELDKIEKDSDKLSPSSLERDRLCS